MKLKKNIFVDTNIIEGNNFFHGSYFHNLINYSNIGVVQLYMTTISKMELINRMRLRLIEAKTTHNKLVKSLNKDESRILRNLNPYKKIERSRIKVEESLTELKRLLDNNIKIGKIKIIPSDFVDVDEVFKAFYDGTPPFSKNEKKKYEFPDAFILNSVETWCEKEKEDMLFLSKDKDFNGYKSKRLVFEDDLIKLLDEISHYYDVLQKTELIPQVMKILNSEETHIIDFLQGELSNVIKVDLEYEKYSAFELFNIKHIDTKITSIRPANAEVTYTVEVSYKFQLIPTVHDLDKFDFEADMRPRNITGKLKVPCEFEIDLTKENGIKLKWINNNDKIRIVTIPESAF